MKTALINKGVMLCVMMLMAYCVNAAAQKFTVNRIKYSINDDHKTVTVIGNEDVDGILNIPTTVTYNKKAYSVTKIGDEAFYGCTGLASVIIPNSVTVIGNFAFSGCSDLTQVNIPKSVTEIGEDAFSGCISLQGIYYEGNDVSAVRGITANAKEHNGEVEEVARYNLSGHPCKPYDKGVQIVVYSDFTTKTIIVE